MRKQRIDRMSLCTVCHTRVRLASSEVNEVVRVFKCQNPDCGAEFGTRTEEGTIQDHTGHLVVE